MLKDLNMLFQFNFHTGFKMFLNMKLAEIHNRKHSSNCFLIGNQVSKRYFTNGHKNEFVICCNVYCLVLFLQTVQPLHFCECGDFKYTKVSKVKQIL